MKNDLTVIAVISILAFIFATSVAVFNIRISYEGAVQVLAVVLAVLSVYAIKCFRAANKNDEE